MDLTERTITLLQANASSGDIAEKWKSQIAAAGESLLSHTALVEQLSANVNRQIDDTVAEAAADILSSGGDLTTIGHVIGSAYSAGLMLGLSASKVASER